MKDRVDRDEDRDREPRGRDIDGENGTNGDDRKGRKCITSIWRCTFADRQHRAR